MSIYIYKCLYIYIRIYIIYTYLNAWVILIGHAVGNQLFFGQGTIVPSYTAFRLMEPLSDTQKRLTLLIAKSIIKISGFNPVWKCIPILGIQKIGNDAWFWEIGVTHVFSHRPKSNGCVVALWKMGALVGSLWKVAGSQWWDLRRDPKNHRWMQQKL